MKLVERSWYSKFGITWLLLPLSALFYLVAKYRFYTQRKLQNQSDKPKVIVVGNIAVGGTGKTPFTVFLVEHFKQQGLRVAVISRGYGGEVQSKPLLVDENVSAEQCGDEPKLIALRCKVPVVVFPKRNESIAFLNNKYSLDVIIADDGLQHYQMPRAIELCIVDASRRFGNKLVLPAGPLREPCSRLNDVDLTIYNGDTCNIGYTLVVDGVFRVKDQKEITDFNEPLTLISAIGNPSRFEKTVEEMNIKMLGHHIFKDHHNYQDTDFAMLTGPLLMTEKDAVKCQAFAQSNWYYLKVSAQPTQQLLNKLGQLLNDKGIHNHGI